MSSFTEMQRSKYPEDPKVFRFDCGCGRYFHLAISTTIPGLYGLAKTYENAVDELFSAFEKLRRDSLGDIIIPDCLPEDF